MWMKLGIQTSGLIHDSLLDPEFGEPSRSNQELNSSHHVRPV